MSRVAVDEVNVPAQDEAVDLAVVACQAAEDKKAADPLILEVADLLAVVDLFVVLSTTNERQLQAVTRQIEEVVDQRCDRHPLRREGTPESGWVLLDYGDVVCQLFLSDRRDHYALERLWADVPRRDVTTGGRLPPLTELARERA